jgi:hypothetical protein
MDIQEQQEQRNERLKTKKKNKMMIDRDGSRNKEMEGIDRIGGCNISALPLSV